MLTETGIGVFQEYYQDELLNKYSSSTISWIPSLQLFFMMGLVRTVPLLLGCSVSYLMYSQGPFVGFIYDRYGPRWLLLIGSFMHVFGIMMASLSTEYYQILLSQGLCSAIGVSAIFNPC
jgi:MFS family permease